MAARFEIDIITRFRSQGLNQIGKEARAALQGIANTPGTPAQRVAAANDIRTAAEYRIQQTAAQNLAAAQARHPAGSQALAQAEAAIRSQTANARRAVSLAFGEITRSSTDFGRIVNRALNGAAGLITAADARARAAGLLTGGGRGGTPPPRPPVVPGAQDPDDRRQRLENARLAAIRKANLQADLAVDQQARAARREEIALRERTNAADRAAAAAKNASDRQYLAAQAAAAEAKRVEAIRTNAAQLGIRGFASRDLAALEAETAVRRRINADNQAAAVARQRTILERQSNSELARASAARRAAEAELTRQLHLNARAEVNAAIARGEGTFFQRAQARFQAGGSNRLPGEFQTGPQFVGSRALTTLGYGVAGTALYGSVRAIGEMIREAGELDRILNQVEAQLVAVGDAASFDRAREGILGIARATGAQADEVAKVFFQFRGAFAEGVSGLQDTAKALQQTDQAMKVVAVTGLTLAEVLDSLTAVAKTFETDIEHIGDVALGVQERFGVLASQTITFVADLAPVAQQIGLSLEDLASLGGVAQQVSGRSGAALAEGFGRVLPQIQNLRNEIISLYNLPQLRGNRQDILAGFASGQTGAVFQQLVRDYDSLSKAQQNHVIQLLGGRREAQVLIPVLNNSSRLTAEWRDNLSGLNDASGKTDSYFDSLRNTVTNTQARLGEMFKQIGEALFSAGGADLIVTFTNALTALAGVLRVVAVAFGALNDVAGGVPGRFLVLLGLMKLLAPAFRFAGQAVGTKVVALAGATRAAATNTQANHAVVIAQQRVAIAAAAAAKAQQGAAAADNAEALASLRAAQANLQQAQARAAGTAIPSWAGLPGGAPGAPGAAASLASRALSFAPILIGFEALNFYFRRTAEEADNTREFVAGLATRLEQARSGEGPLTVEGELDRMEREAAEAYAARGATFDAIPGVGTALGRRGINFIAGNLLNAIGQNGDTALAEAAGQDQIWESLTQQVAAERSQAWADQISAAAGADRERLERLLQESADPGALNEVFSDAFADKDNELRDLFAGGESGLGDVINERFIQVGELTTERIAAVIEFANAGNVAAAELLRLLAGQLETNPELAALLTEGQQQDLVAAAGGQGTLSLQTIAQVREMYESGGTSIGTLINKITEQRQITVDIMREAVAQGQPVDPKDTAALAAMDAQLSELVVQVEQQRLDSFEMYADLLGAAPGQASRADLLGTQVARMERLLNSDRVTAVDKFELIPDMISLLRDQFSAELEAIADPIERARRAAEGFTIPPSLQRLFVAQQIAGDPESSAMAGQIAEVTGMDISAVYELAAQQIIDTGATIDQALLHIINEQIQSAEAVLRTVSPNQAERSPLGAAYGQLIAMRNALNASIGKVDPAFGGGGTDVQLLGGTGYDQAAVDRANAEAERAAAEAERAREEARRAARARADAQINLIRAYANGDPVRLAQLDLQAAQVAAQYAENDADAINAEAQRVQAMQALSDAQNDITNARLELYAQQVARDPVRAAQAQIAQAQHAIATAVGEAAAIRAQAGLIQAQQSLVDAQQDVTRAWLESIESYYNIIGDSVGAANAALRIAREELANVLADPASGQAERIRAETAVREAEAAVRDATFDDQLGDIEYLMELERITGRQAIEMLQAMMQIPGLTEEQLRTLERRINSLRQELSQDFQFNLPTDIGLPTLYEARRAVQGTNQGFNYQQAQMVDNRVITVTLNANDPAAVTAAVDTIVAAVTAPPRVGNYPGLY